MRPTDVLRAEHRVIEKVLSCLEALVERGAEGFDPDLAARMVEFFSVFADSCHHKKEEDLLFPALERRGFPPGGGPTAVMRDEHVLGRRLVQAMGNNAEGWRRGDQAAFGSFRSAAQEYLTLLRDHIQKEDHCLFGMAEQMLDGAIESEILADFARVESDELGKGTHERFLRLARELCEWFGVEPPVATGTCCGHG